MTRADQPDHPYRRGGERPAWRRRLPALATLLVLATGATVVWADLLDEEETTVTSRVSCPPAPTDAQLTPLPYHALRDVPPLPPAEVAVLVRNSTDRYNLATRVAARLELLGFGEAAPPDNDPVYPTDDMRCFGQIRFSPAGRTAARTLSLVAPCAQLVRDDSRTDGAVHLVVGTEFTTLIPDAQTRDLLRSLSTAQDPQPEQAGGLQSLSGAEAPAETPAGAPVSVPPGARSC